MRYALIVPAGAADEPVAELDDQTPLAAANTPNIDWISVNGRQGTVRTTPQDWPPVGHVPALSLFGYDPQKHSAAAGPLVAAALGITLSASDLIFCCDLVTVVNGRMVDHTAGHIGTPEAARVIDDLNREVAPEGVQFQVGSSHRHVMIVEGGAEWQVECTEAQAIPDEPVADHLPRGRAAQQIRAVMERAERLLDNHEVNEVRRDLGENPATTIWLSSPGRPVRLPPFADRFGVGGAVVAASDLIRGLAAGIGFDTLDVPEATGGLDTNCRSKGNAAVAALDDYDLVVVHVQAPDVAGHNGNAAGKVRAIEQIDEHIVGPVLSRIRAFKQWKIMVTPGYATPVARRVHVADPPPFCIAGEGVYTVLARPFSEANAACSDLHCDPGHDLIEYLLKR